MTAATGLGSEGGLSVEEVVVDLHSLGACRAGGGGLSVEVEVEVDLHSLGACRGGKGGRRERLRRHG